MSFQNFMSHIEFMKFCQNHWSLLSVYAVHTVHCLSYTTLCFHLLTSFLGGYLAPWEFSCSLLTLANLENIVLELTDKKYVCSKTFNRDMSPARRGIVLYLEYQSVCPFVWTGSPRPLSRKRVLHPPPPIVGEGAGGSQFGWLNRKPGSLFSFQSEVECFTCPLKYNVSPASQSTRKCLTSKYQKMSHLKVPENVSPQSTRKFLSSTYQKFSHLKVPEKIWLSSMYQKMSHLSKYQKMSNCTLKYATMSQLVSMYQNCLTCP